MSTAQNLDLLKNLSPEYAGRIEAVRRHVGKFVYNTSIKAAFYSYTDHYISHADRLAQIANRLIPKETYHEFNNVEIFILYCAIYLHDIGMLVYHDKDTNPEKIRKSHGTFTSSYIHKQKHVFVLSTEESRAVADICHAHGRSDLTNVPHEIIIGPWRIRLKFLAARSTSSSA